MHHNSGGIFNRWNLENTVSGIHCVILWIVSTVARDGQWQSTWRAVLSSTCQRLSIHSPNTAFFNSTTPCKKKPTIPGHDFIWPCILLGLIWMTWSLVKATYSWFLNYQTPLNSGRQEWSIQRLRRSSTDSAFKTTSIFLPCMETLLIWKPDSFTKSW